MDEHTSNVRYHIFKFCLDHCHPPSVGELAILTGQPVDKIPEILRVLEQEKHLVLYKENVPSQTPIAMVHPFAHLPTPYVVSQGEKSWFANCAWCAFGLASMLSSTEGPIQIQARSGSVGQELRFEILNGSVSAIAGTQNAVIHFSVPPSQWWNDVRFTCSTIQVFESRDEPEEWCERYGFNKGDVIPLDTMWKLAKAWYHDKANYEYKRKTHSEVQNLYTSLGMTSSFWAS